MYLILDWLFIHFSHQQELPLSFLKTYCSCITTVYVINKIQPTRVPLVLCPFFLKKDVGESISLIFKFIFFQAIKNTQINIWDWEEWLIPVDLIDKTVL